MFVSSEASSEKTNVYKEIRTRWSYSGVEQSGVLGGLIRVPEGPAEDVKLRLASREVGGSNPLPAILFYSNDAFSAFFRCFGLLNPIICIHRFTLS